MQASDVKVKAIAVRAVPYGESDMIVTLVGLDTGKITATARGCLKRGAKLRYAAEPFNFGDYVLAGRNGRYVITECSQIASFLDITMDLERYYAGFLVLDSLGKLSEEPAPTIFMSALRALQSLADSAADPDDAVRDFLLSALAINGNGLDFSTCNVCKCKLDGDAYFSDSDGIVCKHCADPTCINVPSYERAYLAGEAEELPRPMKVKANALLCQFVYNMLGVRINAKYLTEQL